VDPSGGYVEVSHSSARQKAASAALFLFAFVGFVASIIAVVSYFEPKGGGVLRVEITPNDFQVPLELAEPFLEGQPSRQMLKDLKDDFCRPPPNDKIVDPRSEKGDPICERATDAEWLARWAAAYSDSPGTLYRYEVENGGSSVAQQIRIVSQGIASIQIKRGAKYANLAEGKDRDYYSIPDLNPHEKAQLLIWMTSTPFGGEHVDYSDAPRITFSGASVQTSIRRSVPESWFGLYDAFGDAPWWLLTLFVIGASLGISLALVLVISVADALIKGKPLKGIFQAQQAGETSTGGT
jgi:hypothetical protein